MGDEKIVELAAFKRKKLAEERETLIQQRKASKKEKKAETKAKAEALSDKQMEITDMFEDEDTKTMLNVSAYDFFDTLKDFNENDSNLSCQEPTETPLDSLSLVTASSLVTLPTLFAALLPVTSTTSSTFSATLPDVSAALSTPYQPASSLASSTEHNVSQKPKQVKGFLEEIRCEFCELTFLLTTNTLDLAVNIYEHKKANHPKL